MAWSADFTQRLNYCQGYGMIAPRLFSENLMDMKKYFFNDEWKDWIWSNVKNGISRQEIYNTLIDNDYDVFTVINELRFIPAIFRKKDEVHFSRVMKHLEALGAKKIDVAIPLYTFENLLTKDECNEIIELQKKNNAQSTTGEGRDQQLNPIRTSFTTYFELNGPENTHEILKHVKEKILSLLDIPAQYSEGIQGQWYQKNGFYNEHFDADENYERFNRHHGNRTWTCMVTLNKVQEGGDTCFPLLDQRFEPKVGQAIIWYNLDESGLANPLTLHAGLPIVEGEKFIITQWFHQCTDNENFK